MPTKTRTLKSRTTAGGEYGGEREGSELGFARGLPGDDSGEFVERGTQGMTYEIGGGSPDLGP